MIDSGAVSESCTANMTNFGEILREVGEFGVFQKRLIAALCIPAMFTAFDVIGQVFSGLSFSHHCNTDWILKQGPNLTEERKRNLTIPLDKDGRFESCRMFTPVDWDLETIEANGINSLSECLHGWNYDAPEGVSSIMTEFDLVCDKNGLIQASQSLYMAGFLISTLVFGSISDRYGRRFAVLLSTGILTVCSMGSALSPNIYIYLIFKFLCGTSAVLVANLTVMGLEWTDPSKSALCTTAIMFLASSGLMVLSAVAYLAGSWRVTLLVLFSPLVLIWGILYRYLPDSPRWLLTQGRKEEAQKELLRAARVNGRKVPENFLEKVEIGHTSKKESMLDIFRMSYLRKRTLIMGFIWFSTCLLYYGLSLNVGSFGVNIYLTQFIFGLVEIPAVLTGFVLNERLGRRLSQLGFMVFGGAACLLVLAIPTDLPVVITVIAVMGKFSVTASFTTVYVYTPELFPTTLRQNGMSLSSVCGRMAGILSPLVTLLGVYHYSIPLLVYGIVPIVAGGFCLLLPETVNVELQDHAEVKKLNAVPTWD